VPAERYTGKGEAKSKISDKTGNSTNYIFVFTSNKKINNNENIRGMATQYNPAGARVYSDARCTIGNLSLF